MEGAGRVQVFARVRPGQEAGFAPAVEIDASGRSLRVRNDGDAVERILQGQEADAALGAAGAKEFQFDGVFAPEASQREVFTQVGLPVLRECLKGFNGTILAYGQTGSGKTHSLLHQGQKGEDAGLLPRLVASLFVHVAQDFTGVYEVEAAAVQVYNETVDDLLHPDHQAGAGQNLSLQNGGAVAGLTWLRCKRPEAMLEAFTRARANVVYAETKMNKASSRSHAVFQVRIKRRQRATEEAASGAAAQPQRMECTHARLNVVDLAGSERVKKSGVEGTQFKEATAINKSLLAFGNVVSALAAKKAHVPLRDSKLTRILDGSIGGNCKTALLVCASPASEHATETLSTFDFASRAMRVEVDAKVNRSVVEVDAKALLADLSSDVEQLGCTALGPELEALRKLSNEATKQAKAEAEGRAKAEAEAKEQTMKFQTAAKAALQQSKEWEEQAANLRKSREASESEVEKLRKAVGRAEKSAEEWRTSAEAREKEAERLRRTVEEAQRSSEEWRVVAETREKKVVEVQTQHKSSGEADAAKHRMQLESLRREAAEKEVRVKEATQAKLALQQDALALQNRFAEAEARAAAAQAEVERLRELSGGAEAAFVAAQAEAQADRLAAEAAAEERLVAERRSASEALRAAAAEADTLREEGEAATARGAALESQLATSMEELRLRTLALDEAQASLGALRAEAEDREAKLQASFQQQLEVCRQAHAAETERLQCEAAQVRRESEAAMCRAAEARASEVAALEGLIASQAARWVDEKRALEAEHAAAEDKLHEDFEARLRAGRESFEARLAEQDAQAEVERKELRRQLGEAKEEIARTEATWQQIKEESVREAWETGTMQQRRLAAAFKAARCLASTKQAMLKEEHDELAQRFASRESRPEDVRNLMEQKRSIEEQQKALRYREAEVDGLCRELQNRDETDRIFSSSDMRRSIRSSSPGSRLRGVVPPLPGKKLGDPAPFSEREKRRREKMKHHSCERPTSACGVMTAPLVVH